MDHQEQQAESVFSKKQIAMGVVAIFAVYGTMAYFIQTLGNARPKIAADLNGLPLILMVRFHSKFG